MVFAPHEKRLCSLSMISPGYPLNLDSFLKEWNRSGLLNEEEIESYTFFNKKHRVGDFFFLIFLSNENMKSGFERYEIE